MKKMQWKSWVREYFQFTKWERLAVLVLLNGIAIIKFLPLAWQQEVASPIAVPDSLLSKLIYQEDSVANARSFSTNNSSSRNYSNGSERFMNYSTGAENSKYYSSSPSKSSNPGTSSRYWDAPPALAPPTLFYFNPNETGEADWIRLGVPARTAKNILKYRQKGGYFKNPQDLHKIYGMPPELAKKLEPFVKLPAASSKKFDASEKQSYSFQKTNMGPGESSGWVNSAPQEPALGKHSPEQTGSTKSLFTQADQTKTSYKQPAPTKTSPESSRRDYRVRPQRVMVNTADSLTWLSLPGIGPTLSGRILQYKKLLGGFRDLSQIQEVYGIKDSLYQQLLPYLELDSVNLVQLNINELPPDALAKHPYIRWKLAHAIVQFRLSHGPFQQVGQLSQLHQLNSEQLKKLTPYCKIR